MEQLVCNKKHKQFDEKLVENGKVPKADADKIKADKAEKK